MSNEITTNKLFVYKNDITYSQYKIYLTGEIEDQADYMDLIQILRDHESPKSIALYVNSPGGSVDAGMSIIHAIQECSHQVVAIVDGEACSMATNIVLACPKVYMNPYSKLMIHNYSAGTSGKGHELSYSIYSNNKSYGEMLETLYKKFLTKREIDAIINGGDMWLHPDVSLASWTSKPLAGAIERLKRVNKLYDPNNIGEVRI